MIRCWRLGLCWSIFTIHLHFHNPFRLSSKLKNSSNFVRLWKMGTWTMTKLILKQIFINVHPVLKQNYKWSLLILFPLNWFSGTMVLLWNKSPLITVTPKILKQISTKNDADLKFRNKSPLETKYQNRNINKSPLKTIYQNRNTD